MILNGVMAVILCYFTEIRTFGYQLHYSVWRQTHTACNRNVA